MPSAPIHGAFEKRVVATTRRLFEKIEEFGQCGARNFSEVSAVRHSLFGLVDEILHSRARALQKLRSLEGVTPDALRKAAERDLKETIIPRVVEKTARRTRAAVLREVEGRLGEVRESEFEARGALQAVRAYVHRCSREDALPQALEDSGVPGVDKIMAASVGGVVCDLLRGHDSAPAGAARGELAALLRAHTLALRRLLRATKARGGGPGTRT